MPYIISSCCMAVLMVRLGRRPLAMSYRKSLRPRQQVRQAALVAARAPRAPRGSAPTVVSANEQRKENVEVGRFLDAVPDARPGDEAVAAWVGLRGESRSALGSSCQFTAGRQSACAPPRSCRSRSRSSFRGLPGSGASRVWRLFSARQARGAARTSADHAVAVAPAEARLHAGDSFVLPRKRRARERPPGDTAATV